MLLIGSVVIGGGVVLALVHSARGSAHEDHAQSFDQFAPDVGAVEPVATALEWVAFL
jgi:hypothetical protein